MRRRSARGVSDVDLKLMRRSAAIPRSRADDVLSTLSRSANHGVLWFTVAAVLATRKGSLRRAGLRGVAALAGASASANLVGKPLFPRRRPAAELLPEHRRLVKRPTSSSFPSGHSASAAAFATAALLENPGAGAALIPLAGAVAYSRVHTGVHWPTDVAAGVAIGTAAAVATQHWWPRQEDVRARSAHRVEVPALTDGAGLLVLVNPGSGVAGEDPEAEIALLWPKAEIVHPEDSELIEYLHGLIDDRGEAVQALGVAGGDGTVAAVAAVAAERSLPLVLVPAGTLNHFARDVGLATTADAAEGAATASAVGIDLGEVRVHDGADASEHRWFVNTASLGGYPEMVRLREKMEPRWGKWPAAVLALIRSLRRAQPIRLTLNGEQRLVWMLFIGNGVYAPKGFLPTRRPALDTGMLDVRYLRADLPYSRARFVLAVLTGTLHTSHVYRQRDLAALDVEILDGHKRLATDGEVGPLGNEFSFAARPSALAVYRP